MLLKRWTTVLCLPLLLGACALLSPGGQALPPLPPVAMLDCCWVSEERVKFAVGDSRGLLHTVVEVNDQWLTVVVLDPAGRRQLTLRYGDDGLRELSAPPQWDSRYSHYLILAIFLHHVDEGDWLLTPSRWQVKFDGQVKTLVHRNETAISLEYTAPTGAESRPRTLRFPDRDHEMSVSTVRRSSL